MSGSLQPHIQLLSILYGQQDGPSATSDISTLNHSSDALAARLPRSGASGFTAVNTAIGQDSSPTQVWGLDALRRPATEDTSCFWYCSEQTWKELMTAARKADGQKTKNAKNMLRKFDAAGRMMETEQGMAALVPCSWCTREGLEVNCMVYKGYKEKACAFCRRNGKGGCEAGAAPVEVKPCETELLQERVTVLEDRVAVLMDIVAELRDELAALKLLIGV